MARPNRRTREARARRARAEAEALERERARAERVEALQEWLWAPSVDNAPDGALETGRALVHWLVRRYWRSPNYKKRAREHIAWERRERALLRGGMARYTTHAWVSLRRQRSVTMRMQTRSIPKVELTGRDPHRAVVFRGTTPYFKRYVKSPNGKGTRVDPLYDWKMIPVYVTRFGDGNLSEFDDQELKFARDYAILLRQHYTFYDDDIHLDTLAKVVRMIRLMRRLLSES